MADDKAIDAPADVIKYAKDLYRTRVAEPRMSIVHRILAAVKMDLSPDRAAFGERSATGGQARQILLDAGQNAIDLRVMGSGKKFDLRGQVLGGGFENGVIEISGPDSTHQADLDAASEFELSGIPAGEYSLAIRNETAEIFVERIILK